MRVNLLSFYFIFLTELNRATSPVFEKKNKPKKIAGLITEPKNPKRNKKAKYKPKPEQAKSETDSNSDADEELEEEELEEAWKQKNRSANSQSILEPVERRSLRLQKNKKVYMYLIASMPIN